MPGAVSRTSSQALCNATLPYVRELASLGADGFAAADQGHADAVNIRAHKIANEAVAAVFDDLPKL
jgi:alanine dehydrogenase